MSIPNWWEFVLLALAAFRAWKLIADDDITEKPRTWVLAVVQRRRGNGKAVYWKDFLVCPWCAGFWISLAWWGAWQAWPHGSLVVATVFALSAVVGIVAHFVTED